ncbi:MAG: hypothetical protein FWD55_08090, partial [Propionibacteriaceae bacterium]|nr:hypothetical protein [Propionibacteriaceae bacterium]
FDVVLGDPQALISSVSGRVTSSGCSVGVVPESGTSMIAVDGIPLVNLATTIPMWRDMDVGDKGRDVSAFMAELKRLGRVSGDLPASLNYEVLTAWQELLVSLGAPSSSVPRDSVSQAMIVWIPAQSSEPLVTCDYQVGGMVTQGQTIATLSAPILSAHVSGQMTQLVEGDRVAVIDDDTTVIVDSDGIVTDESSLATLIASPTVRILQALGILDTLTARYELSTPIEVSVIPPAAIKSSGGSTGCVLGDDNPRAVTIISSQLGQSFVQFDDGKSPPNSVTIRPPSTLECQ